MLTSQLVTLSLLIGPCASGRLVLLLGCLKHGDDMSVCARVCVFVCVSVCVHYLSIMVCKHAADVA